MNTGIPDAHNLVWKLASVLNGESDSTLLSTYETERRPVAIKNCDESRENSENIMEVFSLLGLDLDGMEKLAKAKASFPLRFLPAKLRDRIISFAMNLADRKLCRVFSDSKLKEQADATVARQIGHFDRLGLDIGYTYEEGALIDDGSPIDIADNDVSDYIPSTRPGARLPHYWVETPEGKKSTHDFLAFDRYTMFSDGSVDSKLTSTSTFPIRFVDTSSWKSMPDGWRHSILVRPDGHVAWRGDLWDDKFMDDIACSSRVTEGVSK